MAPTTKRKSYPRETTLVVVQWYHENATSRNFNINRKQIRNWVKDEKVIRKQKQNTKAGRYCKALYPLMEGKLHAEFLELRKDAKSVKRWWFNIRAKQLMTEHHPDITTFNASDGWFNRFCSRKNVSFRRKTHKSKTTQ